MPTIGWTVALDGMTHTVELDHGWLLGRRILRLDGQVIQHTATVRHALLDRGSRHPFHIGPHACEVWIESKSLMFRLADRGRRAHAARRTPLAHGHASE
jgi:hypothetical protein